jgi:hypothetical protein
MSTSPHTEYLVKDGCFFRRTYSEENLGPQTQILKEIGEQSYTIVPDLFNLEIPTKACYQKNNLDEIIKVPVHVGRNKSSCFAAHRMPYWPIFGTINVRTEEDGRKLGSYNGEEGQRIRIGVDYPGLWFLYSFKVRNNRIMRLLGLWVITNIKGKFYAPYLPNIFDNGNLCLGEIQFPDFKTVQECIKPIFKDVFCSISNSHLCMENTYDILKFEKGAGEEDLWKWTPPTDFFANPSSWHTAGRLVTMGTEFLALLNSVEQDEHSPKVLT